MVERAMKAAEEATYEISGRLRYAGVQFSRAFNEDIEYAIARIKILSANLEEIQTKLDDARSILEQVTDPAEPEYDPCD